MGEKRYRALLIGNSVFAADAGNLPRLEGPQKDVTLLHHALVNEASGLFAEPDVRVLLEQPMRSMMEEIHGFFVGAHRDDVLLLYYSGHGMLDEQERLYLCASDSVSTALLPTAVSNSFVTDCIASSPTQTSVLVLDCCYSGAFKGGRVSDTLAGPGRFVMSSCRGRQLANAASAENGASLFTAQLVDALLGKASDRDDDGYIDLGEVFSYVEAAMRPQQQTPQKRFDGERDLVIARTPRRPATVAGAGVQPGHIPADRRPALALSETLIDLRDVGPEEALPDERVAVYNLGEGELEWTAESDATWFDLACDPGGVTLKLHPRPGHNRGKVLVRDQATGAVHCIRVNVAVQPQAPAGPPPRLRVWPAAVEFGRVWEKQPVEVTLDVTNAGGGDLDWTYQATGGFFAVGAQGNRLKLRLVGGPGRHQGVLTVNSNAGQAVVPVSADVVARAPAPPRTQQAQPQQHRPQPAQARRPSAQQQDSHPAQPPDRPHAAVPHPAAPNPAVPRAIGVDSGAQTAQALGIVGLVLAFFCGIGLVPAVVSLVLAGKADARIRAAAGAVGGASQVRTARVLSWIAVAVSIGFVAMIVIGSLLPDTTTA